MRLFNLIIIFVFILSGGCRNKNIDGDYSSFFVLPEENEKNITIQSLNIQTIDLNLPNSSYAGYSGITNSKIFFADKYFCWLYELDEDLNLLGRRMGQGRGPQEIPLKNIMGYTASPDGHHYFVGSTRDLFIYDSTYTIVKNISFIAEPFDPQNDTHYDENDYYSLDYDDLILRPYKDHLYFNVIGEEVDFDISYKEYYQNSRVMMELDIDGNRGIERLMGRMSPEVKYMTAFWRHQYDVDKRGNFYVGFEADSLVYVYDNNYRIKYSFGHSGEGMNTDYLEMTLDNYADLVDIERGEKGYYTSLKKIGNYLFRTYKRGGDMDSDRMQIYDGRTLIGDVDVPINFSVMGYIAPYYYSDIIADEEEETIRIRRFRLDL